MERFNLELTDDFSIDVEMAKTVEDRRRGLSGRDFVDTGMLFTFPKSGGYQMWMKDTKVPLSILFLNESGEVTQLATGTPENNELIGDQDDTKYVLELPAGFNELYNLEVGDALDIPPEADEGVESEVEAPAELLDETGKKQMDIVGEERVFSIEKTAEIVEKAKNAETEEDIIELASLVANEIKAQDGRGDDYVEGETKLQYAQRGAKLDVENNYIQQTDSLLNEYSNLDFVKRIADPNLVTPLDNEDGTSSTHSMSAEVDEEGNWHVFPTVVNREGTLERMETWDALDYAKQSGEHIPVDNPELAQWIASNGYKKTKFAGGNFVPQKKHGGIISTPYDDYLISLPDAESEYGNLRRILRMQGFELTRIKTDPTSLF
jgi:uncharacterized membrane protein (UPF0127 family)